MPIESTMNTGMTLGGMNNSSQSEPTLETWMSDLMLGFSDSETEPKKRHLSKKEKQRERYERLVENHKLKRKQKKERHKLNKQYLPESEQCISRHVKRERCLVAMETGQRICIDLGMEEHMSEKEQSKLPQQLRRLYGSNMKSEQPCHLYFSNINKDGYLYQECLRKNDGFEKYLIDMTEKSPIDLFPIEDIVYLSPDSPHLLTSVDLDKVYVIGGLVDETRKQVSLEKASDAHLATARLPIDEYLVKSETGTYNKILTVNQVFDILLNFTITKDWTQALLCGIPQRCGFIPR